MSTRTRTINTRETVQENRIKKSFIQFIPTYRLLQPSRLSQQTNFRSDQKMSLPKKLGVAFVLLSIVGVLVWLIIGLTEARNDLNALKTELTEAEKEGEKLKFEMAESQAKLVQAKHESKEVEQLQNDVKTLENLLVQSQNENEEMEMRIKDLELDLSVAQNDSRNLGQEAQFLSGKLGQLQKEFEQAQVNATILEGNVENGLKLRENEGDSLRNELNVMNSKFIEALKETSLALNRTQNDTKLLADEVHHLKNDLDDTKNVQRMKFAATQSRSELLSKSLQDLDQNLQSTLHKTHSLTQEIQDLNEDLFSTENSSKSIENQIEALKNHQKLTFVQDCQHLRFYGFQQNGFYSIDPDGPYNPDNHQDHPSIQVFCDFEQNITKVYHKQPSEQSGPSNHFVLDYGSDLAQVKKLVENSRGLCYQEIIYDCYEAPLSTNGINYAWWLDNQGKRQYFLNGAYQNATMKGCALNCNCDDAETSWSRDSGRITADWLLPITGFGFQPYRPSSQMRMTISELICTGKGCVIFTINFALKYTLFFRDF